ncbi:MAG: response regulator [Candidatus Cloacimonetes bacterium]|nr:response regulator [Candidatus Cloacimonadota bacterium]
MAHKILVVDDEQSIRDIIREFLFEMGYEVKVAVDGVDALDKARFETFDLYIIDIYMPRLDGLELLLRIKELQPLAVVIITTGFSSIDVAVKAIRNGAYHYLTKPIQAEELTKVVESGLKHSEELKDVNSISAPPGSAVEQPEMLLLRGFTPEQQQDFRAVGVSCKYNAGDTIPQDNAIGSMLWIESGKIAVKYRNATVETLKTGDIWGEESFITSNPVFTQLIAAEVTQVRHFNRGKLIEFFTYNDETLTKRYMINLVQCIYVKWRRAVYRIGIFSGFSPELPK